MNPIEQKPMKIEDGIMDWSTVYPDPYNKLTVDPYTKIRIILTNGIAVELIFFKRQFHRNCQNNNLRRELALIQHIEQHQQKHTRDYRAEEQANFVPALTDRAVDNTTIAR